MYPCKLGNGFIVALMDALQQPFSGGRAPLVIGGVGGSGTRVYRKIVEAAGYTMLTVPWPLQRFSRKEHHDNYLLLQHFYARWVDRYLLGELSRAELARMRLELRTLLTLSGPAHYGRGLWGWKNPRTLYLLPLLNDVYPEMRYIHVFRDGRDHAFHPRFPYEHDILLSPSERRSEEHVRKALAWSSANTLGQRAGDTFLADRYMQSRLEDLCADPTREVGRIFRFLGCRDVSGVERAARHIKKPSSSGRWREQPAEAVAAVERAVGDHLQRYGYALTTRSSGPGSAARTERPGDHSGYRTPSVRYPPTLRSPRPKPTGVAQPKLLKDGQSERKPL